jgi:beta-N-acetylhexosaminidase
MKPIIFGLEGKELAPDEASFFARSDPFGFILFQRNIETPEQVKTLIADLRATVKRSDAPIFIDQEGGRAVRLKPPHWERLSSMRVIGDLYTVDPQKGREAMSLHARLTAHKLHALGIIGNLAPVLDLAIEGASDVIGDRSLGNDPAMITELGTIACKTYLANGVLPCIKHLPGHGRMKVDPHFDLPLIDTPLDVLRAEDFKPFIALKDIPLGMTSHGIFLALDKNLPVSISPKIHSEIIRGELGFGGLLFSDDLAMKALSPSFGENAQKALAAGTDIVLYCKGGMREMLEIDAAVGEIAQEILGKWRNALKLVREPEPAYDPAPDIKRFRELESLLT